MWFLFLFSVNQNCVFILYDVQDNHGWLIYIKVSEERNSVREKLHIYYHNDQSTLLHCFTIKFKRISAFKCMYYSIHFCDGAFYKIFVHSVDKLNCCENIYCANQIICDLVQFRISIQ